jgi:hypothetical protein
MDPILALSDEVSNETAFAPLLFVLALMLGATLQAALRRAWISWRRRAEEWDPY